MEESNVATPGFRDRRKGSVRYLRCRAEHALRCPIPLVLSFVALSMLGICERGRALQGASASLWIHCRSIAPLTEDVAPPALALAGINRRAERRLAPLRGSAADVYVLRGRPVAASGLRSVAVRLQRFGGDYWNGRSYQKAPFDLPTVQQARSFFTVPASVMPPLPQALGGRYLWTATATDNAGNITRAQQFVLVDATAPALIIETPALGSGGTARVQKLARVSGRVSEATRVLVTLRNSRGAYFNGSTFAAPPFFLGTGQSEDRWLLLLPPTLDLAPGRYTVAVRANDIAGNVGTAQRVVEVVSAPDS